MVDINKIENNSYLLNGVCASRCEVGGYVLRAPESWEVASRIDRVYEKCFESIRKVCYVLSECDTKNIAGGKYIYLIIL